jgi:hypothetical protein
MKDYFEELLIKLEFPLQNNKLYHNPDPICLKKTQTTLTFILELIDNNENSTHNT